MHEIKALLSIVAAGKRGVSLAADPLASHWTLHVLNKDSTLIYVRQLGMRPRMRERFEPYLTSLHLISSHLIHLIHGATRQSEMIKVNFIKINSSYFLFYFFLADVVLILTPSFHPKMPAFHRTLANRRYQLSSSLAPHYLRNSTRNIRYIGTGSTTSHIAQPLGTFNSRFVHMQHSASRNDSS